MNFPTILHRLGPVYLALFGAFGVSVASAQQCTISIPMNQNPFEVTLELDAVTGQSVIELDDLYALGLNLNSSCCTGNCNNSQAWFYTSQAGNTTTTNPHQIVFNCSDAGSTRTFWMAIRNGNNDQASESTRIAVEFEIEDVVKPIVIAPNDRTVTLTHVSKCDTMNLTGLGLSAETVFANLGPGEYFEKCNVASVLYQLTGATVLGWTSINGLATQKFNAGKTTITYRVEDNFGNVGTDEMILTVNDISLTKIKCPTIGTNASPFSKTINTSYFTCDTTIGSTAFDPIEQGMPNGTFDQCGFTLKYSVNGTAFNSPTLQGGTLALGTNTVVWTASDASGHSATCSLTITVRDQVDPRISLPVSTLSVAGATIPTDSCGRWISVKLNTASAAEIKDNCTATNQLVITWIKENLDNGSVQTGTGANASGFFPVGRTRVRFIAEDAAGNVGSDFMTITVTDPSAPVPSAVPPTQKIFSDCSDVPLPDYRSLISATDPCATEFQFDQNPNPGTFITGAMVQCSLRVKHSYSPYSSWVIFTVMKVNDFGSHNPLPIVGTLPKITDVCGTAIPAPGAFDMWIQPGACPIDETELDTIYGVTNTSAQNGPIFIPGNPPAYKFPVGIHNVLWTYDDPDGGIITQTQIIEVLPDNVPPIVQCKTNVINKDLNVAGTYTLPPLEIEKFSDDPQNCGPLTYSVSPSNFNCSSLGINVVTLTATDANGNTATCTAQVRIRDEIAPTISNVPADVTVECTPPALPNNVTATDVVCGPVTLAQPVATSNQTGFGPNKYNYTLNRTWVATDNVGNKSTRTQVITVRDTQAPVWTVPSSPIQICTDPNRTTCNDTVILNIYSYVADCAPDNELILKWDSAGTFKPVVAGQFRQIMPVGLHSITFSAQDSFSMTSATIGVIQVNIRDCTTPVASCIAGGIAVTLNAQGTVTIQPQQINAGSYDNCTTITPANLSLNRSNFTCADVGQGPIQVRLTVTDAAGNTSFCLTNVTVQENSAPVISNCPANVTVTCAQPTTPVNTGNLTAAGIIELCGLNSITSSDSTVNDTAGISCRLIRRTWKATDNAGNMGTCLQLIRINDAVAPVFTVGPTHKDTMIACISQIDTSIAITATDNCSTPILKRLADVRVAIGSGACATYDYELTRRWQAWDDCGNLKLHTQKIRVKDTVKPTFPTAPASITVNTATSQTQGCEVIVNQLDLSTAVDDCAPDNAITGTVQVWQGNTLVRTLNGLNGNGNFQPGTYKVAYAATDPCGNVGRDTINLTVIDNTIPTAVCINSVSVNLNSNGSVTVTPALVDPTNQSTDNCGIASKVLSPNTFDCGQLGQTVSILTVTDFAGNSNSCTVNVTVGAGMVTNFTASSQTSAPAYFGASNGTASVSTSGGSGNFAYSWSTGATTAQVNNLAAGTYTVSVTDTGSNCRQILTVVVPAGPKLHIQVDTVNALAGSMVDVEVTADRFINMASFQLSLHVVNPAVATVVDLIDVNAALDVSGSTDFFYNVNGNDITVLWSNANGPVTLPNGSILFKIKVNAVGALSSSTPVTVDGTPTAIDFNQDFSGTSTSIPIDITNGLIQVISNPNTVKVGGEIKTWAHPQVVGSSEKLVPNVLVSLAGGTSSSLTTAADGAYEFTVSTNSATSVTCSKVTTGNPSNAVSGLDLLFIVRHIFAQAPFVSPYQWVAADVNNSGTVSVADYSPISQYILNALPHIPNSPDWRFVPSSHVFGSPNPLTGGVSGAWQHNPILQDHLDDDFVAVRMGDVTGNAPVTFGPSGDDRDGSVLNFKLEDRSFRKGDLVTVPFRASADFKSRDYYQMTLAFDPKVLALEDISGGNLPRLSAENFGTARLSEGLLTTLWVSPEKVGLSEDETAFSLTFKALADGEHLSKNLRASSDALRAEALNADGSLQKVDLEYLLPTQSGGQSSREFALFQNQPNPFSQETTVGFRLPEAAEATLRVFNAAGQLVKTMSGNFEKGYNEVRVRANELGQAGVYWLELDTPGFKERKKMIFIE